jgi:hypothetical protein
MDDSAQLIVSGQWSNHPGLALFRVIKLRQLLSLLSVIYLQSEEELNVLKAVGGRVCLYLK